LSATLADAAHSGPDPVTLLTGIVLAVSAAASPVIMIVAGRRRAAREALAAAKASGADSANLTLAGWTALNQAQQAEIQRLQGLVERMQARADQLQAEMESLRKLAAAPQQGPPGASS
jgi:hypothetical protein